MNPELTGFALGLLLGAAKIMTIGTVGFAIAWWRARRRVRELEAEAREAELEAAGSDRIRQLEGSVAHLSAQLHQLLEAQSALTMRLGGASLAPPDRVIPSAE